MDMEKIEYKRKWTKIWIIIGIITGISGFAMIITSLTTLSGEFKYNNIIDIIETATNAIISIILGIIFVKWISIPSFKMAYTIYNNNIKNELLKKQIELQEKILNKD